jgi:hypothetical protein
VFMSLTYEISSSSGEWNSSEQNATVVKQFKCWGTVLDRSSPFTRLIVGKSKWHGLLPRLPPYRRYEDNKWK